MNIDEIALTKLLTYGTTTPLADPNTHIRPDNSVAPTVTYSMIDYMTTGGGRFAKPSSAPLIQAFFADSATGAPVLTPGTSYSLTALQSALGVAGGLNFSVSNYTTGGTAADFLERAYVFGGSNFQLSPNMTFDVDAAGVYSISNLEVIALEDDFDFQSGSIVGQIGNAGLIPAIDPYGLIPEVGGNTTGVRIQWDASGGASYATYGQAEFDSDTSFVDSATGAISAAAAAAKLAAAGTGLLTGTGYLANINADRLFDYYTVDGKKIVYGTNGDDDVDQFPHPFGPKIGPEITPAIYTNYQMVGGAGNDMISSGNFDDELWGGDGDDTLKGNGGSDQYFGGAGTDTVEFQGECLEYDIVRNADGSIAVNHVRGSGADGSDTLIAMETALFSDGKELDLTASEIYGCTSLGFVQDFVTGTTDDTQIFFDLERMGDTSYDVDVLVSGSVTTGNATFFDFIYTIPAGETPQLILGANVAGVPDDVAFDFEISIEVLSPLEQLVTFTDATAGGVLIGDGVDDQGGWWWGDPHLITFDNVAYDFQAEGEFILARATTGDPYELQARFKAISSAVSVADAMGTRIGTTAVSIEIDGDDGLVRLDGLVTEIADGEVLTVGPGTITRTGSTLLIDHGNGDQTETTVFATFLNATPRPGAARVAGGFEGLLGNDNGTPADEFKLADGTVLTTPVPTDVLYGAFAASWSVTAAERLLPGSVLAYDAPDRIITIDSLPTDLRAAATAAVDAAGITNALIRDAAILDFALTGNADFITAAQQTDAAFDPIVDTIPVDPVSNSVILVTSDFTVLDEETPGSQTATITVSRGDTIGDLTVNYVVSGAGATPASDSDIVGGLMSGSVVVLDGQEAATFTIDVVDDSLDEGPEEFDVTISLNTADEANYEVLVSSVRLTINDNDTPVGPGPRQITASNVLVSEGTDADQTITVTLTRTGDLSAVDTVDFATVDGTAMDGIDFNGGVGSVTFAVDQATSTITFTTIADSVVDSLTSKDFIVQLSDTASNATGLTLINASVTILDDDLPNTVPVATDGSVTGDEDKTLNGTAIATDLDGDSLTYSIGTDALNGSATVNPDGTFTYVPDREYFGPDSFTYQVDDGKGGIAEGTITVTVNSVNDAPTFTSAVTATTAENTTAVLTVTASDVEGDSLTISIAGGADAAAFTIDPVSGILAFVNAPDFEAPGDANGDNIFDVDVSVDDGNGGMATQSIAVSVTDVTEPGGPGKNLKPEDYDNQFYGNAENDPIQGTAQNDWIDGRGGNDKIFGGAGNDYIIAGAGKDHYVRGGTGADIFQFGLGDDNLKIFDWEDGVDQICLVNGLSFSDFTKSTSTFNGITTVAFTTDAGERIQFRDQNAEDIDAADFASSNAAPNAIMDVYFAISTVPLNIAASIGVLQNDTDTDGDTLTSSLFSDVSNGTLVLNTDGSFTYVANAGFVGEDSFTYLVADGNGGTDTAVVTLTVSESLPGKTFKPEDYDNQFYGDAANDPIQGTALNDWIDGGDGNDKIFGGAGDDYIIAGAGKDYYVRGGAGADVFQFGSGDDNLKIFDWEDGIDKICLSDGLSFGDLTKSTSTFNGITTVSFTTNSGDRILFRDQDPAVIDQNDFL